MIEFDEKAFIKFSGEELSQLQGLQHSQLQERKSFIKEIQPNFDHTRDELNQIVEENNATNPSPSTTNTMSNNMISPQSASDKVIQIEESSGHFGQVGIVEETIDQPTETFEVVTQEIEELKVELKQQEETPDAKEDIDKKIASQKVSFCSPV